MICIYLSVSGGLVGAATRHSATPAKEVVEPTGELEFQPAIMNVLKTNEEIGGMKKGDIMMNQMEHLEFRNKILSRWAQQQTIGNDK